MNRSKPTAATDPFGEITNSAPSQKLWTIGAAVALSVHIIGALPFLPEPEVTTLDPGFEDDGIGVRLAPLVAPPEAAPPPPEEAPPPEETPVIEERADDSPPPAPPPEPRELPDIPDIKPQAVPDMWLGSGGGAISLEDYLTLGQWHNEVRRIILQSLAYPPDARNRGISGRAVVVITVNRNGSVAEWEFRTRTGQPILDREIRQTLNKIRRLPPIPPDTKYERIAFSVPIRFELVYQDTRFGPPPPTSGDGAAPGAPQQPTQAVLPLAQLRFCAQTADGLTTKREEIRVLREELESIRTEYERQLERYERQRRDVPLRVRRMRATYDEKVKTYQALVSQFETQATAFQSACGQGTTTWDIFVQACSPYASRGNAYCEAYGDLWNRLSGRQ